MGDRHWPPSSCQCFVFHILVKNSSEPNGGKKKMIRCRRVLPGVLRQHDYMGTLPLILHMLRGKQPLKITGWTFGVGIILDFCQTRFCKAKRTVTLISNDFTDEHG